MRRVVLLGADAEGRVVKQVVEAERRVPGLLGHLDLLGQHGLPVDLDRAEEPVEAHPVLLGGVLTDELGGERRALVGAVGGRQREEGPQHAGRLQQRDRVVGDGLGLGAEAEGVGGVEVVEREEGLGEERERLVEDARLAVDEDTRQAGLAVGEGLRSGPVEGGHRLGVEVSEGSVEVVVVEHRTEGRERPR